MNIGSFGVAVTVPNEIDATVIDFCKSELELDSTPLFVNVETSQDAIPLDCFANVKKTIELRGGGRQFGWIVWKHEDHMIEAEFHAVWLSPDGMFVDVTPHDGQDRVVFIVDEQQRYFGKQRDNVRRLLNLDDYHKSIFAQITAEIDFMNNPPPGVIVHEQSMIGPPAIGRNDACPCGSDKKYKKCCGPLYR